MNDADILNQGWILETKARFPALFRGLDPLNFECGPGWEGLVVNLIEQLDGLGLPDLRVSQIKQKFGNLRVYVRGGDERAETQIARAQDASRNTCEWCGAPGDKDCQGAILTLCLACQAKRMRDRTRKDATEGTHGPHA